MLSTRFSRGPVRFALPLALAALLGGCPDPDAAFDDFVTRYDEIQSTQPSATSSTAGAGGGGGGGCTVPEANAADGDYLMALAAKLNPKKPLTFLVGLKNPAAGDGVALELTFQPLAAADRKTPVGDSITVKGVEVGTDGAFTIEMGKITVPGEANPISGSEIVAVPVLSGTICDPAELLCGAVTGTLEKPIPNYDLTGSTFGMARIDNPDDYPDPVINCAGDVAPP